MLSIRSLIGAVAIALLASSGLAAAQELPQTGAEKADWSRHTSYEELVEYIFEVQSLTDNMLIQELTETPEGRTVFLIMLGDPPTATPGTAWLSGKPTVLLVENVHGGELSGREGGLQLLRELALGELKPLLEKLNILYIPSINPDGANRQPRPSRGNTHGFDMNRDYAIMQTAEISAVVEQVLTRWWPDVHMDAHNGGSAPYNLTYQATLDPSADSELVALANGPMFEAVKEHMASQDLKLFWYSGPRQNRDTGEWAWGTTEPLVRKQHSYSGFQNVIALLFECPGPRGDLELQARSQREGQEGLLRYVAENGALIRSTVMEARRRTVEGVVDQVYLGLEATDYPDTVEFFVRDPDRQGEYLQVEGTRRTLYRPTGSRERAWAYAFDGNLHDVADLLRRHAIEVEKLMEPVTITVQKYRAASVEWATRPYQGHIMLSVEVEVFEAEEILETGTFLVRSGQNGGILAAHLLEPETQDSVVSWNFLDHLGIRAPSPPPEQTGMEARGQQRAGGMPAMGGGQQRGGQRQGSVLPIYRIMTPVKIKAVLLP
jgi:predicted deacylase